MGLFTDKCIHPDCGERIAKNGQFCPACGSPAPRGKATCGQCGAEVPAAGEFCWSCGANLHDVAAATLAKGRWVRQPGDFAARIDHADVKGWLRKPVTVEHGTQAMFFQKGKFRGVLGEGRYNVGGFLRKLNHFMIEQAASMVLLDAGDVTIDLENDGLRTADSFQVGCAERLVLRISDPEAMFVNLFKGAHRIGLDEIERQFADEVQVLLSGIIAQHPAERLFTDLTVRTQIESALREALSPTLQRLGLELVQLRFVRFVGEAWEQLAAQREALSVETGEADIQVRRAELNQRLREVLTRDRMDSFQSEKELEEFVRQTEHEMGLKDVIREDEMARLRDGFQRTRDRETLLAQLELDDVAAGHRRQSEIADAETKARIAEIERQQDAAAADAGIERLKKVKEIEHEEALREQDLEARKLEIRGKATAEALLTILDGPAADRIVELEKFRAQQSLSPEQVLALAAAGSPEAAQALAKKYQAEGQVSEDRVRQLEQQLRRQQETADGYADRMERILRASLEQMGRVAGSAARPVVVGAGGQQVCRKCGAALPAASRFCPQCGQRQ